MQECYSYETDDDDEEADASSVESNTTNELSSSTESSTSLDRCLDTARKESIDLFNFSRLVRGHKPQKRRKTQELKPITYVRFNSRLGKAKPITLKCLLDTGASASLVDAKHATKLRMKKTGEKTLFTTPAGSLNSAYKAQCSFMLPEFHPDRVIEWDLHITKNMGTYDMIIGRDILSELEIKFDFADMSMEWDERSIPMKDSDAGQAEAFHVPKPDSVENDIT